MTTRSLVPAVGPWRIVADSVFVALVGYVVAGAAEIALIRVFRPSERELAWVSDVVLSLALGVAVYLWRHLAMTRQALLDRERAELVLNTQLALAADLQRRLLPTLPMDGTGVEWAAALRSAGQIGGDFYDLVPFDDGRTMLLVADVSGKGIPAAMALSTLRAAFRAFARPGSAPGQVLTQLSDALHEQWAGTPYLTGIVALIDGGAGTLQFANAAHPAGLVVGPSGTRTLDALGPPAALLSGSVYHERTVDLERGDVCVFVSDGVTEALGDDALADIEALLQNGEAAAGSARDVCDTVMAAALRGTGPEGVAEWDDDRTVVVLAVLDAVYAPRPAATRVMATLALCGLLATAGPAAAMPSADDVSDLALAEVPAAGSGVTDTWAVILTGDGGWADLDQGVAATLAARGIPVVGWSSLTYYWSPRTPAQAAADLARIVRHYTAAWQRPRVIVIGYSFGADVAPFLVNRLPDDARTQVAVLALLAPSATAAFEFHVAGWLGAEVGVPLPTSPEIVRLTVPTVCVTPRDEPENACRTTNARVDAVRAAGGHHFNGDYRRLVEVILRPPV